MAFMETLTAINGVISIWEGISSLGNAFNNRDGVLIAYKYEIRSNLNLLKDVNFDALANTDVSSAEFRNLIMCLQTQIGASILYDSNRKYHKSFKDAITRIGVNIVIDDAKEEAEDGVENLFKAMQFSVDKIEHLKRLVICANEGGSLLNNFNLRTRVNNIFKSLKEISIGLQKV